jgi:putative flippase GtrA
VPRFNFSFRTLHQYQAPRFLVVGFATFVVDIGSLKVLHGVLGVGLALSTLAAFAIAFLLNFTASRHWVFAGTALETLARRQLLRYFVLVFLNLCSTLMIVVGLSALGVPYLWAKVVSASINAVANFFAYRHWVFAARSVPPSTSAPVGNTET